MAEVWMAMIILLQVMIFNIPKQHQPKKLPFKMLAKMLSAHFLPSSPPQEDTPTQTTSSKSQETSKTLTRIIQVYGVSVLVVSVCHFWAQSATLTSEQLLVTSLHQQLI